ncbi:MAG: hypothetical protein N2594_01700 [Clostridiales bacterium]|nr:hypothetical protein [Clostridiales bacterium]
METTHNTFPFILSFTLSYIVFLRIDKRYEVSKFINSVIKISPKWRRTFILCLTFLAILLLGILGIYVVPMSATLYFLLSGAIWGLSTRLAININVSN